MSACPSDAVQGCGTARILHATTVAWEDRAILILGRSGAGKSSLGLRLMAFGCSLVADDRTALQRDGDRLVATCPERLVGLIEARGIGILRAQSVARAWPVVAVDLDRTAEARLPPARFIEIEGIALPVIHKIDDACFPAAILQYVKGSEPLCERADR